MFRRNLPSIAVLTTITAISSVVSAQTALQLHTPTSTGVIEVRYVAVDGVQIVAPVHINPVIHRDANLKRDSVLAAIVGAGGAAIPSPVPDELLILDAAPGSDVQVFDLGTGERRDLLRAARVQTGAIAFAGWFAPFEMGPSERPAIFTAGIVTDVGELAAQISAQELNFQTDGPIICQALFQRLAPRAPDFGVTLNYAGDRLEVYFDPAYTITQGGIVFGTTSPSPGCSGGLRLPLEEPGDSCGNQLLGDMNGDGSVDNFDIDPFVQALTNPELWREQYPGIQLECAADINQDGVFNNFDIDPFVAVVASETTNIRLTPAVGEVFCRYEITSSTNPNRLRRNQVICVNCPTTTACPDTKKFKLVDGDAVLAEGTWTRLHEDCRACRSTNRSGYGF